MAFESTSTKSPMAGNYVKLALWYFALCIYRLSTMPPKMKRVFFFFFSRKASAMVNHWRSYAWSRCGTLAKKAENIQNAHAVQLEMTTKIWAPKPRQIKSLTASCIRSWSSVEAQTSLLSQDQNLVGRKRKQIYQFLIGLTPMQI